MPVNFLIAFLGCLMMLNYRLYQSVLYPPFIFSAVWLLVFAVYQAKFIEIDPLHEKTILLVGMGALLFSLGGILAKLVPKQLIDIKLTLGSAAPMRASNKTLKYLLIAALCLGTLLIFSSTLAAGAQGSGGTFLQRARSAGVENQNEGMQAITVLTYVPVWCTFTSMLFLIEEKDRLFWIMSLIAFTCAVLTTGRGPILLLFSALLAIYLLKDKKDRFTAALKFARVPVLAFLCLFIGLIFTNKDTSMVSGGVLGIILLFAVGYIVTPVAALDYVLQHPSQYTDAPQHTFKFLLQVATSLHLVQYTPPPFLDQFVTVPLPTNVYTGYKFFYTDFGFWGCLVAVTTIAFLQTLIYRKAIGGSQFGIYCFAFTVFPTIMFIFDDLYSAIGEDINMFAFGCLYILLQSVRTLPGKALTRVELTAKLG